MEEKTEYKVYPKTVEAACNYIINQLTEEQIESIKQLEHTYDLHFTLGTYIRNNFRPFIGENEELIRDCIKHAGTKLEGDNVMIKYLMAQYQGDEASGVILRELKERIDGM